MPRFVMIVEWGKTRDLGPDLERARAAMTFGGSGEHALELQRPGFGAVVLSHESELPALLAENCVLLAGGHGLPEEDDAAFVSTMAKWMRGAEVPVPRLRQRPLGRRCFARWDQAAGEVLVVTEPNGVAPLHLYADEARVVLATEPKGIWALVSGHLHPDADSLVDLFTVGECLGERTLFREVRALPPGAALRLRPGATEQRSWYEPRFSARTGGSVDAAAERMNAALTTILSVERQRRPRATVALSGGMDSRYLLAGARRVWDEVTTLTFGPPDSRDVVHAAEVARRVGVRHEYVPWSGADLSQWAPYGVWRSDGMQSCIHHHGMDALITRAGGMGLVLNGMGGDILTGAFLRPMYLLLPGSAERTVDTILSRYRLHYLAPQDVFKPEVLRERRSTTRASLLEVARRQPGDRLGNSLLGYWVRQHCPRLTSLGIELEAPFLEYATPLADPFFVDTMASLSLEQRFLGRAYRRALGSLLPEALKVACDRYGVAPHWPWPVLAVGGLVRRLGLVQRPRLRVSYTEGFRAPLRPWVRDLLLDPRTLADGFLLPKYVRALVEDHATQRADHAPELGMALALELWRRMFMAGETTLGRPPVPLPQPRAPLRLAGDGAFFSALSSPAGAGGRPS